MTSRSNQPPDCLRRRAQARAASRRRPGWLAQQALGAQLGPAAQQHREQSNLPPGLNGDRRRARPPLPSGAGPLDARQSQRHAGVQPIRLIPMSAGYASNVSVPARRARDRCTVACCATRALQCLECQANTARGRKRAPRARARTRTLSAPVKHASGSRVDGCLR